MDYFAEAKVIAEAGPLCVSCCTSLWFSAAYVRALRAPTEKEPRPYWDRVMVNPGLPMIAEVVSIVMAGGLVEINQHSNTGIRAVATVAGESVCAGHMLDVAQRPGRR